MPQQERKQRFSEEQLTHVDFGYKKVRDNVESKTVKTEE
jgi:hypothetical protein